MDAVAMEEVSALISAAWRADGARPLNDHLWLDLREGGRQGFAGVIARDNASGAVVGYCQVSRGNESWSLDLIVHPVHRYDSLEIAPDLIRSALNVVASEGGGHVHWWVFEPNNIHRQLAQEVGLHQGRRLLQLRRTLPLPNDVVAEIAEFESCAFRPGIDEADWLAVNNSAFGHHPEQGGWTREILLSRMAEPWFDPEGFRLHHEGNELGAFCWTKIHNDTEPAVGEIYVIAANPSMSGRGLGRRMAISGLHYIEQQGITEAMLYVDADNASALAMYTALGFTPHHEEHAFVGDIAPGASS
jgi:mycothiol synthase